MTFFVVAAIIVGSVSLACFVFAGVHLYRANKKAVTVNADGTKTAITRVNPYTVEPYTHIIGYKRAWLRYNWLEPFTGVSGFLGYGVEGEQKDANEGFYAYHSLDLAKEHPQEGNVYLEVIQSGDVKFHEDGQISTKQRVLQVIISDCTHKKCSEQAEYWQPTNESNEYRLEFFCTHHAEEKRTLADLETSIRSEANHKVLVAPMRMVGDHTSYMATPRQ